MLFNSIEFLFFFPIVTLGYFVVGQRIRWAWLLAASCIFYMAFVPAYILILGFTIVIDYIAGIAIESATDPRRRRAFLTASILSNVGILAFFKYTNFLVENINETASAFGVHLSLPFLRMALPIGLSFHTFQAMAYTIEVYRGKQVAERHFGYYALYVMFYPQLVAGPIERPQNVLPQLHANHTFDYKNMTDGLKLMAWGLFQKIIVADRLAAIVNPVFAQPEECHALLLAIASVAFTFEIYLDFAGYSDIALGAAQCMGITLMPNFRRPFFAQSISEFWSRWHISLSTWFRDYLYIPLGGNRVSRPRWHANLFVVFLVSGLWHGANWTFVAWGAIHGAYLIIALVTAPHVPAALREGRGMLARTYNVCSVFLLVCVAFVFFRARTVHDAVYILTHIPTGLVSDLDLVRRGAAHAISRARGLPPVRDWVIAVVGLVVIHGVHLLQTKGSVRARLSASPLWVRWPAYVVLTYSIVAFANPVRVDFIYFKF